MAKIFGKCTLYFGGQNIGECHGVEVTHVQVTACVPETFEVTMHWCPVATAIERLPRVRLNRMARRRANKLGHRCCEALRSIGEKW